ncbi:Large exoproteins involved in heme utilization or adhesion [invertebrate metagenome]|uniref:Large exoproteins involved in heme utilization or adhesion n=1 Tax=invertebrate metagenome TaxID=1711999 RepID=A0A484HA25_9ZZZZ
MVRRALRFQTLGMCSLMLLLGVLLLIWRASLAPVPLNFLTPYIQMVLNPDNGSYQLTLSGATLQWVKGKRTLDLQAIDMRIKTPDGQKVALSPALSFSLSLQALSHGLLAPHTVEITDSHLYLRRTSNDLLVVGRDSSAKEEGQRQLHAAIGGTIDWPIGGLLAPPALTRLTGYLERIQVMSSSVTLDDQVLGITWTATNIDLEITHDHDGIGVDGQLLLQTEDGLVPVMLTGHQAACERQLSLTLTFANLRPTTRILPLLQVLGANVDLPVAGTLSARLDGDWRVHGFRFLLTGGSGVVTLSPLLVTRCAVRSLTLQGTIGSDFRSLMLDRGTLDLGKPKLALVAAVAWLPFPVPSSAFDDTIPTHDAARSTFSGHYDVAIGSNTQAYAPSSGRQAMTQFSALSPSMGSRAIALPGHQLSAAADITLNGLPVDDLTRYWPGRVGSSPRTWIATRLRDGVIEQARFTANISSSTSTALTVKNLHGRLTVRNITISSLKLLSPIRQTYAVVTFHPEGLEVQAENGKVQDLRFADGSIAVTGIGQIQQFCLIEFTVIGSVAGALHIINSTGYATALELRSAQAGGAACARLALMFPIVKNLTLEQIAVKAHVQLSDLTLTRFKHSYDLTHGDLALTVDTKRLHMTGRAALAGIFVRLEWEECFKRRLAPVRSRYTVHSCFNNTQRVAIGLNLMQILGPPYLNGPVQTNLVASVGFDGLGTATVETDLAVARMKSSLGWHKLPGQPGRATVTIRFTPATMYEIPRFTVEAHGATLGGRVAFTLAGRLERLIFEHLQLGRTELTGALVPVSTSGLLLSLTGPAFDLEPLLHTAPKHLKRTSQAHENEDKEEDCTVVPDLAVELTVARLWGSRQGCLTTATLTARREGGLWRYGSVEGIIGAQSTVRVSLASIHDALSPTRVMTATSEDAGAVLQMFHLFNNMIGGRMRVNAILEKAETRGTTQVDDYRLVNAPLLARLLTMAALTGILESLTGDGLRFTSLDLAFIRHNSVLSLAHFRTSGPSLGLTATGQLFLENRQLEMYGTIVPIYFVNSLFGNVPFLGEKITGEKGSGLFAATYTITGAFADPAMTVNPLAAVIPSFLRNLFKFDDPEHNGMPGLAGGV